MEKTNVSYLVRVNKIFEAECKFNEVFDSYCNVQTHLCCCRYLLRVINASTYKWESENLLDPLTLSH